MGWKREGYVSPAEVVRDMLWEEAQAGHYSELGQPLTTLFTPHLYEDINIFVMA